MSFPVMTASLASNAWKSLLACYSSNRNSSIEQEGVSHVMVHGCAISFQAVSYSALPALYIHASPDATPVPLLV